ncbi:DNA/RNA non-specific endonuclease [Butyricicoccus pullicaecorum]|uniref:DNA/RNA non-specific endonuclease n=1 Tax=Butyricicoccus pullicaecorum TaxID=501571 RepID=UPI00351FA230
MKKRLFTVALLLIMVLSGCAPVASDTADVVALSDVPEFSGEPYVVINDNEPSFPAEDFTSEGFEEYSPLDDLGRCGVAYANVGLETMPTEERGSISNVKPTGWKSVQYDFVDGKSLYNRCHLIGFQLTGENANRQNLITGTRYMNVDGMLPFENMVADYVKETENHVLYRVTPIFEGDNLVASGVQMEAQSVEDKGEGVCFNVYVYNNQPGVTIDYATGDSWASDEAPSDTSQESTYILNTSSRKFHKPNCDSVETISPSNKKSYTGTREELINQGYEACGKCKP